VAEGDPQRFVTGVNVCGYLTGELGLGAAARGYISALKQLDLPLALNDLTDSVPGLPGRVELPGVPRKASPYTVNLITVPAQDHEFLVKSIGPAFLLGRYNIGVWFWELPEFPEEYRFVFDEYDELWGGSAFIAETLTKASPIPVSPIPPAFLPATEGDRNRGRQRIAADDDTIFLFVFDFWSVQQRKNPLAVIEAFNQAFSPSESARLVIKSSNSRAYPNYFARMNQLAQGRRITLYDGYWTREEVQDLMAACDVYVSLHRAEGLGLTLLEAMSLGKPVIATGWSGNMDFMTDTNSFPVRYELAPIRQSLFRYEAGQLWAESSVEQAAELMRYAFDHPEQASQTGHRAKADVARIYAPSSIAARMRERFAGIEDRYQAGWRPRTKPSTIRRVRRPNESFVDLDPGSTQPDRGTAPSANALAGGAAPGTMPEPVWRSRLQHAAEAFAKGRPEEGHAASLALLAASFLPEDAREQVYRLQAENARALTDVVPGCTILPLTQPAPGGASWFSLSPVIVGDGLITLARAMHDTGHTDFLIPLDDDLRVTDVAQLKDETAQAHRFDEVRPFVRNGTLHATVLLDDPDLDEWTRAGVVDIVDGAYRNLRVLGPRAGYFRQGWAPIATPDDPRFLAWWEPTEVFRLDWETGNFEREALRRVSRVAERFWSASQAVPVPGGYLLLVNETIGAEDDEADVTRFARIDDDFRLTDVSPPFFVAKRGDSVATGLARRGNTLFAGFSSGEDLEALATMELSEVLTVLTPVRVIGPRKPAPTIPDPVPQPCGPGGLDGTAGRRAET
jgi:glycosyltransferase involved in cell wall biosynthesis